MGATRAPRARRACTSAQATRVLPTPVSVPVTNTPRSSRGLRREIDDLPAVGEPLRRHLPGVPVDDLARGGQARRRGGSARRPRSCAASGAAPEVRAARAGSEFTAPMAFRSRATARTLSYSTVIAPSPSRDRRSPRATSASPRSCMSTKRFTCGAPSASANAARSSLSVSGPERGEEHEPVGRRARAASAKTREGSHHCSARLEKTSSTDAPASGRRSASAQTSAGCRAPSMRCHHRERSRARASIAGARSMPTRRAAGKRFASASKACPVPQPRSTARRGSRRIGSRCSRRRAHTSRCSTAAPS